MFDLDFYLFCFDLKGAYHHISLKSDQTIYVGFSITEGRVTRYFVFLPFRIATARHIFSKGLKVVVKYLRGQGHEVYSCIQTTGSADAGNMTLFYN